MKIELSEFDRSSTLMRGIMDRFRKVIYQEFIKKAKQNPSVITTNHATIQCYESDKDYMISTRQIILPSEEKPSEVISIAYPVIRTFECRCGGSVSLISHQLFPHMFNSIICCKDCGRTMNYVGDRVKTLTNPKLIWPAMEEIYMAYSEWNRVRHDEYLDSVDEVWRR